MDSGIQLQPRDLELLAGLHECRVMTLAHIAAIHFGGHAAAAKKRVQRLQAAQLLGQRPRRIGEAAVYVLKKSGWELLQQQGLGDSPFTLTWVSEARRLQVSESMLRHELAVMDAKTAIFESVRRQPELAITEFSTRPARYQFKTINPVGGDRVLVKPDGYIRIADAAGNRELRFFLEVDRSTEALHVLARRILCHRSYYKSGGFAEQLGHDPAEYRALPFRVLVVCKSRGRCEHLIDLLGGATPPIRRFVIVTTLEQLADLPF